MTGTTKLSATRKPAALKAAALCASALALALCLSLGCTDDGITGALIKSRPQHTVTFNPNGGYLSDEYSLDEATKVYSGTPIKSLPPLTRNGHTFEGWFDGTGANATRYTKETKVTKDVNLTARWTAITYTLTVSADPPNAGSVIVDERVSPGVTTHNAVSGNDRTTIVSVWTEPAHGYVFVGWSGASTGTGTETSVAMDGNKTLTANFKEARKITVSVEPAGGGRVTISDDLSQSVISDNGTFTGALASQASVMATPSNADWTFVGWSGASESTGRSITVTMDSDLELTATFYTLKRVVSFDANGGTLADGAAATTVAVDSGTALGSNFPGDPARMGYVFGGWLDGAGTQYTGNTQINENAALTAAWAIKRYTVSFNTNGGTPGAISPVTVDSAGTLGANLPEDPTKDDYDFVGWFDGAGAQYGAATVITASVALTAKWKWGNRPFTDLRDGTEYKTVMIGDQVWMAENLNYETWDDDSWCYGDEESNCEKYGRLYNWDAAMEACPDGWHLPTNAEWTTLVNFVGSSSAGKKLKSKTGWNGTDDYGFSALPGGLRYDDGSFSGVGSYGFWWSATEGGYGAYYRCMYSGYDYVSENTYGKSYGLSVRCAQ